MSGDDPKVCARCGRRYRPYKVLVSFRRCTCPGQQGHGHHTHLCLHCGWEAWTGCHLGTGQQVGLFDELRAID